MSDERRKFPRELVKEVFLELGKYFDPQPAWVHDRDMALPPGQRPHAKCERFCAVGGFRRGKAEMKDLEILYIPRMNGAVDPDSLFGEQMLLNVTEQMLEGLLVSGVLVKRHKCDGTISAWGPENKHAVHVASGLPIDLFAATEENYFNRLVVTTGPMEMNIRIAQLAHQKVTEEPHQVGWEWEVFEAGFVPRGLTWADCPPAKRMVMKSEKAVFDFVGMTYREPQDRHQFLS